MAHPDETLARPGTSPQARIVDWFDGTRLAQMIDAVRGRPDTLGTLVVITVSIGIYLFTSSRDRQNLDYFVRLADAFLHGRIYLTEAPSWLNELIPKDGVWYVAYPPFPAVLLSRSSRSSGSTSHPRSRAASSAGSALVWPGSSSAGSS